MWLRVFQADTNCSSFDLASVRAFQFSHLDMSEQCLCTACGVAPTWQRLGAFWKHPKQHWEVLNYHITACWQCLSRCFASDVLRVRGAGGRWQPRIQPALGQRAAGRTVQWNCPEWPWWCRRSLRGGHSFRELPRREESTHVFVCTLRNLNYILHEWDSTQFLQFLS